LTMKPPAGLVGDSTPGVVTRNDSVTRNVPAASRLPAADAPGCQHRAAMSSAAAAEDQLVQSEQAVAANLIALYKALGGGWEIGAPAADALTPAGVGR
jgi:hypothetical protein